MQFELVYDSFLLNILVGIDVLLYFMYGDLLRFLVSVLLLSQRIDRSLHLLDGFIRDLLILLFKIKKLVPQQKQLSYLCGVIHGQLLNHFLLLLHLLLVLLDQSVIIGTLASNLSVLLRYESFQCRSVMVLDLAVIKSLRGLYHLL